MGLGAYLAAVTDKKHYDVEQARERRQVMQFPEQESEIMFKIFSEYGIGAEELQPLSQKLRSNPDIWVKVRAGLRSILFAAHGPCFNSL